MKEAPMCIFGSPTEHGSPQWYQYHEIILILQRIHLMLGAPSPDWTFNEHRSGEKGSQTSTQSYWRKKRMILATLRHCSLHVTIVRLSDLLNINGGNQRDSS